MNINFYIISLFHKSLSKVLRACFSSEMSLCTLSILLPIPPNMLCPRHICLIQIQRKAYFGFYLTYPIRVKLSDLKGFGYLLNNLVSEF